MNINGNNPFINYENTIKGLNSFICAMLKALFALA